MFRILPALILALLLTACTSRAPITNSQWLQHQEVLAQMQEWELNGKVAFITAQERGSAALWMQESPESSQLVLSDPFGGRILAARENADGATLQLRDGQTIPGPDMQTLLDQYSPWPVPLAQLRNWLKGQPDGANYQLNESGLAGQIEQDGWQAELNRYRSTEGISLPHQVNLEHESVNLKIQINKWRL